MFLLYCMAKGPGPDRLGFGLGGQGSWAGPAWVWLGGPRVLGRTGLGVAPFSKSTIFNCFQFKKSETNLDYDCIFTVFLKFPRIGFALIRNLVSSFGKAPDRFCTEIPWTSSTHFLNFPKYGIIFSDFSDSRPKKSVFGPGDVFDTCLCPIFYRFVYHMENVPQILSDTLYKFFLCMSPSIWH